MLACTGNTVFHRYQPLPAGGWDRRDTLCFCLPQAEEDVSGTLYIGLRTTARIGIRDIVLAVEQCGRDTKVCRCDTVRYPLTDAEGNALEQGVNSIQFETQCLPFVQKKGESRCIRIHHLMAQEVVTGITDLGIRIE